MAEIWKGTVSSLEEPTDRNGDYTRAKVIPDTKKGDVTRPIIIPWWLRGEMGQLAPETPVVYTVFEDLTGFIVGRADGEWPGVVPGDVTVTGKSTTEDLITGQVPSYNGHIHEGVEPGGGSSGGPK